MIWAIFGELGILKVYGWQAKTAKNTDIPAGLSVAQDRFFA